MAFNYFRQLGRRNSPIAASAIAALFMIAFGAAAAGAQRPVDWRSDLFRSSDLREFDSSQLDSSPGIRPLEQGIEDIGGLGVSLRLLESGIYVPTGFSEIYPVPGRDGMLMRVSGGLYAVFPRSVYTQDGATVPDNTIFHIGPPEFLSETILEQQTATDREPTSDVHPQRVPRLSGAQATRLGIAQRSGAWSGRDGGEAWGTYSIQQSMAAMSGDVPSIVRDPEYRARRLLALMREAALPAKSRSSSTGSNEKSNEESGAEASGDQSNVDPQRNADSRKVDGED